MIKLLALIMGLLMLHNYTEIDLSIWLYIKKDVALATLFAVLVSPWVVEQIEA